MRYLKTYKESLNISIDRENIPSKDESALVQSYKKKIDDCILYLTETYDVKYIDKTSDFQYQDTFEYSFEITTEDNIDEFIDVTKRSIDRLKYELNGDVELQIQLLRGQLYGELQDIEFDFREEYRKRTERVKMIGENANTFVGEITLIIN